MPTLPPHPARFLPPTTYEGRQGGRDDEELFFMYFWFSQGDEGAGGFVCLPRYFLLVAIRWLTMACLRLLLQSFHTFQRKRFCGGAGWGACAFAVRGISFHDAPAFPPHCGIHSQRRSRELREEVDDSGD